MSGTDIVHVPHKTSGDMRTSVLGGHVQMMFDAITVLAPTVREGKLVALGTSGKKRSSVMPEVPTIDEAGVPGYESTIWLGVMAPAKTPQDVVDTLNAEIRKIMARPDVKEAWAKQGANPMIMTPAEFDKYLRADIEKWAKVVSARGWRRRSSGLHALAPSGDPRCSNACIAVPHRGHERWTRHRHSSTETVLRYFAPMMRQ